MGLAKTTWADSKWTVLCLSSLSANSPRAAPSAEIAVPWPTGYIGTVPEKQSKKEKTQPNLPEIRFPLEVPEQMWFWQGRRIRMILFVGALHQLGAAVLLLYRHFMSDVTASLTEVIPSTVT